MYDLGPLLSEHPGGAGILMAHAGKDVTDAFRALGHSDRAREIAEGLVVGTVGEEEFERWGKEEDKLVEEKIGTCEVLGVKSAHEEELTRCVPKEKKRIAVIGAGICGTAVAYFLSHIGHDVVLIDKAPLVGGTALQSTAIMYIGPVIETKSTTSLSSWSGHTSYQMMEAIQKNWQNIDFIHRGTLGVIPNQEIFESLKPKFAPGGLLADSGELVSKEKMLQIEPVLSPTLFGASWHPKGACVDPYLVCQAYTNRAMRLGCQLALQHEVVGLERHDGKFRVICKSLKLDEVAPRTFDADEVIISTGWLCNKIGKMLGHDVPVKGMHGQLFTTKIPELTLQTNLFSWEGPHFWSSNKIPNQATLSMGSRGDYSRLVRHFYAVQTTNGTIKIGGDRIPVDPDSDLKGKVIESGIRETIQQAAELIPALKNCEITGKWSGTMPFTPNQTPILGKLEPGLWVMAGSPFTKGPSYAYLIAQGINGPDESSAALLAQCSPKKL